MEKSENYELTLLARQDVSDEDVRMALQTLKDIVISNNGAILYAEYWGLRQLEYEINKNENAHFYMVQINSNKEINKLLTEKLQHSTIFIRYLIVVADKDSIKIKSPNCLTDQNSVEENVVFDRRFYNIIGSVFNVK